MINLLVYIRNNHRNIPWGLLAVSSSPDRLDDGQRSPFRNPNPDVREPIIRLLENLLPIRTLALSGVEETEHYHVHSAVEKERLALAPR